MIFDAYTFCWNEEIRLPYFLRQWSPIARRIIVYDNGSNDRSKQIALSFPNVVWDTVTYGGNKINEIKLRYIKNNCWRQSRDADLCFVGDLDEFMYHPVGMHNFLFEAYQNGFTVFKSFGYQMVSKALPVHEGMIYDNEDFKYGVKIPKERFDKCTIFSPKKIVHINYSFGAHYCNPTGKVKMFRHKDYKLLHYKLISKNYYVSRLSKCSERLNHKSRSIGVGVHYDVSTEKSKSYFERNFKKSSKII